MKEIKGHLLRSESNKVVVKSFSGATTKHMYDYVNPTLEMKPDTLIIHCGTNDLRNEKDDRKVVNNIVNLAVHCHNKNVIPIIVSALTHRDDKFKNRIKTVNEELESRCLERNIGFIKNENIGAYHLNRSKLHLNNKGTAMLAKNMKKIIHG